MSEPIDAEKLATMFKALSHPHRVRLFAKMAACCAPGTMLTEDQERACVAQLGEGLGIASSTLSHHLKELRQADLIRMRKQGQLTECWVEPEVLRLLSGVFSDFLLNKNCCVPQTEPKERN